MLTIYFILMCVYAVDYHITFFGNLVNFHSIEYKHLAKTAMLNKVINRLITVYYHISFLSIHLIKSLYVN